MTYRDDPSFTFEPPPPGKTYLGSIATTTDLIERFTRQAMGTWERFGKGEITKAQAAGEAEARAQQYGDIIMGRDDTYATAPWQTRGRMAGKIRHWIDGVGPTEDEGTAYFKFLGNQIAKACISLADGMAEEEVGPRIQAIMKDAAEKLAGVQP